MLYGLVQMLVLSVYNWIFCCRGGTPVVSDFQSLNSLCDYMRFCVFVLQLHFYFCGKVCLGVLDPGVPCVGGVWHRWPGIFIHDSG